MTTLRLSVCLLVAAAALVGPGSQAVAIEGGTGAHLSGSRDTIAVISPPPGTYVTIDLFRLDSTAGFLPISGLGLSEVTSSATVNKLNVTHSFDEMLWGGQPYITLTLPYVTCSLSLAGELKIRLSGGSDGDERFCTVQDQCAPAVNVRSVRAVCAG